VPRPAADGPAAPAVSAPARPGPRTDRLIDEAIETLRGVPFEEVQRRGWHFQPNHFYWPLNDVGFLEANRDLWHDRGLPRDVRWDLDAQLALVARLDSYRAELADVPRLPRPGRVEFVWENNAFGGADAAVLYGLVRELGPRRVVEVGAGWSSLLLARALARNETACDVTLIEPHPNAPLLSALPEGFDVQERTLQRADLAVFERLGAGDLCLFDGSHCSSTASDVNWFLFEVMPRLARGVWVHVHDILLPEDYRDRWILDEGLTWNEQYVVQALLMHNEAYAVRVANHMLWTERRADVERLHGGDGTSLWLEKLVDAELR
jgi:predicted O-methyltransferase YrrM